MALGAVLGIFIVFFLGAVFLGIGILLRYLSGKSKEKESAKEAICTVHCKAVIVDVIRKSAVEVGEYWYYPVFQYTVDGVMHTVKNQKAYMTNWWRVGTEVDIYVNPQDPEMIYCPQHEKGNYKILSIIGTSFIVGAIVCVVVTLLIIIIGPIVFLRNVAL